MEKKLRKKFIEIPKDYGKDLTKPTAFPFYSKRPFL